MCCVAYCFLALCLWRVLKVNADVDSTGLGQSQSSTVTVEIVSEYGEEVDMYWEPADGSELVFQSTFKSVGGEAVQHTYVGHVFVFKEKRSGEEIRRVQMKDYIGHILLENKAKAARRRAQLEVSGQSVDDFERKKDAFMEQYFHRTGVTWKNYWPREPVIHYMYDTQRVGQRLAAVSHFPKWRICTHADDATADGSVQRTQYQRRQRTHDLDAKQQSETRESHDNDTVEFCRELSAFDTGNIAFPELYTNAMADAFVSNLKSKDNYAKNTHGKTAADQCTADGCEDDACAMDETREEPLSNFTLGFDPFTTVVSATDEVFEMEVLCDSPRVVLVRDFLSAAECEHLIAVAHSTGLSRSTVASSAERTEDRTSATAWIPQMRSEVVADIYARIGNVVRIAPHKLRADNGSRMSEALQMVFYGEGNLYKAHYDYEANAANNRFLTFLMYLNTPEKGGNTSFPKAAARCQAKDEYFGLNPGKGSALFFYNLLPDGNVDDKSLHFGEPPLNGSHKYMTNLWIWDPYFRV